MAITLNPSITRNNVQFGEKKTPSTVSNEAKKEEIKRLLLEIEKDEDKNDGPIQKWKNFVSGWKSFFMHIREYTAGSVSGLFQGGIAGGVVLGISKIKKMTKQVPESVVKEGAQAVSKFKKLKPKNYILPGAILVAATAVKLYKTSLKVSILDDKLERKYGTGHSDELND